MNAFANGRADLLTVNHPLFSPTTVLTTEPIKELYQVVRHVLLVRENGCCFTAQSGAGKTRALMLLEHLLRERMPQLVIIQHSSWNHQVPSIRAFFKHFLTAVGHPELRGETFDLRHRLVCRLIDLARSQQSPFVVLLIDEANAMLLADFLFLKDVYNDLDREGILLVTIMMGQDPDFSDVIAGLREQGKSDLVSRFARRRQALRLLSRKEDVAGIFRQIDAAVWPPGSGQTWTQFFVPDAWAEGFRLENETDAFFEAVKACSENSSLSTGFPARPFFAVIRNYLTARQFSDAFNQAPPLVAWEKAIELALLTDSMDDAKGEAKRIKWRQR